jgi:hypothetical protein
MPCSSLYMAGWPPSGQLSILPFSSEGLQRGAQSSHSERPAIGMQMTTHTHVQWKHMCVCHAVHVHMHIYVHTWPPALLPHGNQTDLSLSNSPGTLMTPRSLNRAPGSSSPFYDGI